jgi:hypothetical protein
MDFQKQKITVKELQQCCIVRGIAKSGLKADLIKLPRRKSLCEKIEWK